MTRVISHTNFHSSQLIRCLAELDLFEGAEPTGDFADELGRWMHFTDAIAVASVLENGRADFPAQSPAIRETTAARLQAEFERVRTFMHQSITKSCTPRAGKTAIMLPLADLDITYGPYQRFYEAHQRDMELSVEPLRVNLRAALAKASPALRKLAEIDLVMDKFLRPRETQLLARVPVLLHKRFKAGQAAHQERLAVSGEADNPTAWLQPGGWLADFCQHLHALLLAEAELRLQPSAGLLEALTHHENHE